MRRPASRKILMIAVAVPVVVVGLWLAVDSVRSATVGEALLVSLGQRVEPRDSYADPTELVEFAVAGTAHPSSMPSAGKQALVLDVFGLQLHVPESASEVAVDKTFGPGGPKPDKRYYAVRIAGNGFMFSRVIPPEPEDYVRTSVNAYDTVVCDGLEKTGLSPAAAKDILTSVRAGLRSLTGEELLQRVLQVDASSLSQHTDVVQAAEVALLLACRGDSGYAKEQPTRVLRHRGGSVYLIWTGGDLVDGPVHFFVDAFDQAGQGLWYGWFGGFSPKAMPDMGAGLLSEILMLEDGSLACPTTKPAADLRVREADE